MRYLCLLVVLMAASLNTYSQRTWWENGLTRLGDNKRGFEVGLGVSEKVMLEKRWSELGESLATESTGFEGTYAEIGYSSGYFLRFSAKHGFILIPYFDQDLIMDFSSGRVEITKDLEVVLIPDREMTGSGRRFRTTPRIWIPASNGGYIVPKGDFASFGMYYGGFGEFNGFPRKRSCDECGTFARRIDERAGPALEDFPAPPAYRHYLRAPIVTTIVSVGKRHLAVVRDATGFFTRSSLTPVQLSAGQRLGVKPGLMFLIAGSDNYFDEVVKITSATADRSEGIVIRSVDKNGNEAYDGDYDKVLGEYIKKPFPPIRVGMKVTTSPLGH